jgi:hypothetical protein
MCSVPKIMPKSSNKHVVTAALVGRDTWQNCAVVRHHFAVDVWVGVLWVHCHHGMARPRVADRGDGLQIWRLAANILNKQSQTADSGWSSSLGVGRWANNPSP